MRSELTICSVSHSLGGHAEGLFADRVLFNTSYRTTGGLGPLPPDNDGHYVMLGRPHHSLCWVYQLSNEFAFLQFTNYRLAEVFFTRFCGEFDP